LKWFKCHCVFLWRQLSFWITSGKYANDFNSV
jgi:hypothetical protein